MNPMAPIPELVPGAEFSRETKYKVAWDAINDSKENQLRKTHAKCWLTYRAVDGAITFEDWSSKIENVVVLRDIQDKKVRLRWITSQNAAEMYLLCLNGKQWQQNAENIFHWDKDLILLPNLLANYLRASSLLAYSYMLDKDFEMAAAVSKKAIESWQKTMSGALLEDEPSRFFELRNDYAPLHALTVILYRCKAIKKAPGPESFVDELTRKTPWWKCMEKIGRDVTIW